MASFHGIPVWCSGHDSTRIHYCYHHPWVKRHGVKSHQNHRKIRAPAAAHRVCSWPPVLVHITAGAMSMSMCNADRGMAMCICMMLSVWSCRVSFPHLPQIYLGTQAPRINCIPLDVSGEGWEGGPSADAEASKLASGLKARSLTAVW